MPKHKEGAECESCNEKLKTAHTYMQEWFHKMKSRHPDAHISWAWRGQHEQNLFVAEGKSKLPWPMSKHNKIDDQGNPCSLALDLFELASNGMACWRWIYFKQIADETKADGDSITWGGDWNGNGIKERGDYDSPHFEMKEIKS